MILRLVLLISLFFASTASAQIGTGPGTVGGGCNASWTATYGSEGGTVFITVYGQWKGARFAAPMPACVGVIPIDVQPLNGFTMTGTLEDGISIDFGGCLAANEWRILRIDYAAAPGQVECCPYPLQPHPDYGQIQLIDCNDNVVVPTWTHTLNFVPMGYEGDCGVQFAFPAQIPTPANGAVDVAPTGQLQWYQFGWVGCVIWGFDRFDVYFGTTPNPPLVESLSLLEAGFPPHYDAGALEPETTYYWRIGGLRDSKEMLNSPVWSFTTAGLVKTKQSTWGAVKALYRK